MIQSDRSVRGLAGAVTLLALPDFLGKDSLPALDAAPFLTGPDARFWLEIRELPDVDSLAVVTRGRAGPNLLATGPRGARVPAVRPQGATCGRRD